MAIAVCQVRVDVGFIAALAARPLAFRGRGVARGMPVKHNCVDTRRLVNVTVLGRP